MNIFDLPVHPSADVWPMLDADDLTALAVDIKQNGLQHPIIIGEVGGVDMLIDGRNRLAACKLASVEPVTERFEGKDPATKILSENALRRNVSKGQIAMAVALMFPETAQGKSTCLETKQVIGGVSKANLSFARSVIKYAPELIDRVMKNDPETKKPLESLESAYAYAKAEKKAKENAAETAERYAKERENIAKMLGANPEDSDIEEKFRSGEIAADIAEGMLSTREDARRNDRQGWWDLLVQLDNYGRAMNAAHIEELAAAYINHGSETDVDALKIADKYLSAMAQLKEALENGKS